MSTSSNDTRDFSAKEPESFGSTIRKFRKALKLSQVDLAQRTGYTQATISKLEKGQFLPPADKIEAFADVLKDAPGASPEILRSSAAEAASVEPGDSIDLGPRGTTHKGPAIAQAVSVARSNQRRIETLRKNSEALAKDAERWFEPLRTSQDAIRQEFLEPFLALATRLEGLDIASAKNKLSGSIPDDSHLLPGTPIPELGQTGPTRAAMLLQQESVLNAISHQLVIASAGLVGGVALGGAAAASTFAVVGVFATASTGTAISALSGAAATNAALAFLGGGSMAAGGLGISGGIAVLSTIVAAPAVLATGVAVTVAGRKMLAKQRTQEQQIEYAEAMFAETRSAVEGAYPAADYSKRFLDKARARGAAELTLLANSLPTSPRVQWLELGPDIQERASWLLALTVITLGVLPLPVILAEESSGEDRDDFDEIPRANDSLLDAAHLWLARMPEVFSERGDIVQRIGQTNVMTK